MTNKQWFEDNMGWVEKKYESQLSESNLRQSIRQIGIDNGITVDIHSLSYGGWRLSFPIIKGSKYIKSITVLQNTLDDCHKYLVGHIDEIKNKLSE